MKRLVGIEPSAVADGGHDSFLGLQARRCPATTELCRLASENLVRERTVNCGEFGVMTLNDMTDSYETDIDIPFMLSRRVSISAEGFETGVMQMHVFLAWLTVNHRAFKLPLEREIQNYDLIWDNVWDSILGKDWVDAEEGFLAEYLTYESVVFDRGKIRLWIDTSGLHTDHMVRVTMNEAMEIECCEML